MGFLRRAARAYAGAVRRALPLLVVLTVVVDSLLFVSVDPAPPTVVALWSGVYVGTTVLCVTFLFVCYLSLSRSLSPRAPT